MFYYGIPTQFHKPLNNIQDYDRKGLGGVFMEDLQESLPRCDKIIQRLLDDDRILVINAADKKKVVFLRDNAEKLQVSNIANPWRS